MLEIGVVAGVVLSLLFKYVPGLSDWYEKKESQSKELFMLGIMAGVVAVAFGLSCVAWLDTYVCTVMGARDAVFMFVAAVVGNVAAYQALSHQKRG